MSKQHSFHVTFCSVDLSMSSGSYCRNPDGAFRMLGGACPFILLSKLFPRLQRVKSKATLVMNSSQLQLGNEASGHQSP